jgi:hypothetical protein
VPGSARIAADREPGAAQRVDRASGQDADATAGRRCRRLCDRLGRTLHGTAIIVDPRWVAADDTIRRQVNDS